MDKKTLILALIKDDLINETLIRSFRNIGIHAEDYRIHARDTVFILMAFPEGLQTEPIRDHYEELSKLTTYIDHISQRKAFEKLAIEIYEYLITVSPKNI